MADTGQTITIIIKAESTGTNSSATNPSGQTGGVSAGTNEDNGSEEKSSGSGWGQFALQELSYVSNIILSDCMYEWDKQLMLTDDYVGQRNKSIAMQHLNKATSSISTVLSSTATGASIGRAWGAAIGAIVGVLNVGLSTTMELKQGRENWQIQMDQLNASLDFTRSRAGYSTQAGSIGEDL